MFNLIPLLPLDGGHIAGALGRGCAAGSPGCATGPTRARSTSPSCCRVAYGVAILLIGMSVLLIYADIVNPVTLG